MNKMILLLGASLLSPAIFAADWQALPSEAPAPSNNPTSAAKVELGKMLFMDPRFSSTGTVACNSCHNVMEGGDDDRQFSMGIHGKTGGRNAPTVWNSAFASTQFWDGRAASLEEQAKGPVTNPVEMGMPNLEEAFARVKAIPGYADAFRKAYGSNDAMTIENAAKAVAAFERTLITPNSPYDQFVKGNKKALNKAQQRGMKKFAELGCTACHSGAAFNGPTMPEGQGFFAKFPTFSGSEYDTRYELLKDNGRYEVSKNDTDKNMWRVPTLRNISLTAPYFHNGAVKTLSEAVRVMARTQLNKELSDKDTADVVAFLDSLTGEFPAIAMPRLPGKAGETTVN